MMPMKTDTEEPASAVAAVRKAVVEAVRVATTMSIHNAVSVNMKKKTKRIGAVLLPGKTSNSKEMNPTSAKKAGQEDARRRNKNT